MGFWDLMYFSWFAFLGLAVCAVFGAAFYESTAAKNRRRKAVQSAIDESELQEEPDLEESAAEASEPSELEETTPVSDVGFEELDEQSLT